MCVGKKMCGSQYSLRLNVLERLVYKNLKAPNFYKIICIFLIIGFILMIFVIFYIIHYFKLENGVQYLYKQYDKMNKN